MQLRPESAFRPALVLALLIVTGIATEGSDNVYVSMSAAGARAAAAAQARAAATAQARASARAQATTAEAGARTSAEAGARSFSQAAAAANADGAISREVRSGGLIAARIIVREQDPERELSPDPGLGLGHRYHHALRHPYGYR